MAAFIRSGKADHDVRLAAMQAVSHLPEKDLVGEARAIQQYVRDHVRYVRDINDTETLQEPGKTLQFGQGDCDDKTVLVATMLEMIGFPTRIVAVGKTPLEYDHVLPEVQIGNRWIPVETTERVGLGWYPPGYRYRMVKEIA